MGGQGQGEGLRVSLLLKEGAGLLGDSGGGVGGGQKSWRTNESWRVRMMEPWREDDRCRTQCLVYSRCVKISGIEWGTGKRFLEKSWSWRE